MPHKVLNKIQVPTKQHQTMYCIMQVTLHGRHVISSHRQLHCLFNNLFVLSGKGRKHHPTTGPFWPVDSPHKPPVAESVSMSWRHCKLSNAFPIIIVCFTCLWKGYHVLAIEFTRNNLIACSPNVNHNILSVRNKFMIIFSCGNSWHSYYHNSQVIFTPKYYKLVQP